MSNSDWINLGGEKLDVSGVVTFVSDPAAGGIDVFLGTTRGEKSSDGKELLALDYEAYSEMAIAQMQRLGLRAREKFPIIKLAILHRIGRVNVGEPSVIIAVSCAHRGESFDACRFIIDTLKKEVAIWKKEVWEDGSMSWVDPAAKT